MPGLSYDESGSLAAYFGLTFLSLILIPSTLISLKRGLFKSGGLSAKNQECPCAACQKKNEEILAFKKRDAKGVKSFGLSLK